MSPRMKALGIDRLSIAERIALVEEIWDSVAEERDSLPLTSAQREDLQHRLDESLAYPECGADWEEVFQRLRSKT
ncbi:MAG: addiction module protein [Planctomycetaceae bacterium]|nr:addiction module protein [Planctomycetaceae bacterium]